LGERGRNPAIEISLFVGHDAIEMRARFEDARGEGAAGAVSAGLGALTGTPRIAAALRPGFEKEAVERAFADGEPGSVLVDVGFQ
jgi:hypothetical protein